MLDLVRIKGMYDIQFFNTSGRDLIFEAQNKITCLVMEN